MKNLERKPHKFDRNLVVIGGGRAGFHCALLAAKAGASVSLVHNEPLGGRYLHKSLVPMSCLYELTQAMQQFERTRPFTHKAVSEIMDFVAVMNAVQRNSQQVAANYSAAQLETAGIELLQGQARFISPWTLQLGERTLNARNFIIATGRTTRIPAISGLQPVDFITPEQLWDLSSQPKRLAVIGAGVSGCQLAQAMARMGTEVLLIEQAEQLLPRADTEAAQVVEQSFVEEGIEVYTGHKLLEVETLCRDRILLCEHRGRRVRLSCDRLLICVGQVADVDALGLADSGLPSSAKAESAAAIAVDRHLRIRKYPHIFACGEVLGMAFDQETILQQARVAVFNALFGRFKMHSWRAEKLRPQGVLSDPQIAWVGIQEAQAKARQLNYELQVLYFADVDRARLSERTSGFIKTLTLKGTDRIIGVTIVGQYANEQLAEFVLAMQQGLGMSKILATMHTASSWSQSNRQIAAQWQKQQKLKSPRLQRWLSRYLQRQLK